LHFLILKNPLHNEEKRLDLQLCLKNLKNSKDSLILTVVVEDSAALLGIGVAALGIFLTDITGNTQYDAISSIIIGIILMAFAFFLAKENRGLLLGESLSPQKRKKIIELVSEIPEVNKVVTMKTMHLSPTTVLVGIEINLIDGLDTDKIERITDVIGQKILTVIPDSKKEHIFIESVR